MWNTVQVINQFKEVWHSDVVKKIKNSFFFNVFVLYYMLHITHVMSIKLLDKVCIGHNFMDMFFWSFFLTDRIQCEALRYYIHYSGSIIETWVGLVFAVIGRLLYTFLIAYFRKYFTQSNGHFVETILSPNMNKKGDYNVSPNHTDQLNKLLSLLGQDSDHPSTTTSTATSSSYSGMPGMRSPTYKTDY